MQSRFAIFNGCERTVYGYILSLDLVSEIEIPAVIGAPLFL